MARLKASPSAQRSPPVVAMHIHEDELGEILDQTIGALGQQSKRFKVPGGTLRAVLALDKIHALVTTACEQCLELSGGFTLRLEARILGIKTRTTSVRGKLSGKVPLRLAGSGSGSQLTALTSDTRVEVVSLKIPAVHSSLEKTLSTFVSDGLNALIQKTPRQLSLARWAPMKIPGSRLRLTATEMVTQRDQLWVGFAMDSPAVGPGLRPQPLLKEGERLGLTFDADAITALVREAMLSAAIPSRLGEDLKPDPEGQYRITLNKIMPAAQGLETSFTVWHLPNTGACYAVDAKGLAAARVKTSNGSARLNLSLEGIEVVDTRGDDTLIRLGLWARSAFVTETMSLQTKILTSNRVEMGPLGQRELLVDRLAHHGRSLSVVGRLGEVKKSP